MSALSASPEDRAWWLALRDAVWDFTHDRFSLQWVEHGEGWPADSLPAIYSSQQPQFCVLLDGTAAGELSLGFHRDPQGDYVNLKRVLLRDSAQSKGFVSAMQQHLEERFAPLGVDRLRLSADDAGGYAWATLGYDFDIARYQSAGRYAGKAAGDIRAAVRAALPRQQRQPKPLVIADVCGGGSPAVAPGSVRGLLARVEQTSTEGADLVNRLRQDLNVASGLLQRPADVAAYGRGATICCVPAGSWLGREVLVRSVWFGVKPIQRLNAGAQGQGRPSTRLK